MFPTRMATDRKMPLTSQRLMNTDNTNTEDPVFIVTIESLFTNEEKSTHVKFCKSINKQVLQIPATQDELPELKVLRDSQSEAKLKPVIHEDCGAIGKWKLENVIGHGMTLSQAEMDLTREPQFCPTLRQQIST